MLKGIFVGYKLNPGGTWSGEYLVFDKEAFVATTQGKWVKEHTTKEIYMPGQSADDAGHLAFPVRGTLETTTGQCRNQKILQAETETGGTKHPAARKWRRCRQ